MRIQGTLLSTIPCLKEAEKSNRRDEAGNLVVIYNSFRILVNHLEHKGVWLKPSKTMPKVKLILEGSYLTNCPEAEEYNFDGLSPEALKSGEYLFNILNEECFYQRKGHLSYTDPTTGVLSIFIKCFANKYNFESIQAVEKTDLVPQDQALETPVESLYDVMMWPNHTLKIVEEFLPALTT